MKFFLALCTFFLVHIHASEENNTTELYEPSQIDIYHGLLNSKVHEWAIDIDEMILGFYGLFSDDNETVESEEITAVQDTGYFGAEQRTRIFYDINISDFYEVLEENRDYNFDINYTSVIREEDYCQWYQKAPIQTEKESEIVQKQDNTEDDVMAQSDAVDEFFLTRRLLEERDKSYVRVSFIQGVNSLEDDVFNAKVRARLALGRSRKRLKLFFEDLNKDSAQNIGKSGEEDAPSIGIDFFSKGRFGIKPKYSIGFRGIDPFVRARFSYTAGIGIWRLEPVQTFTYSLKDEFSESTDLFLDRPMSERNLLRFVLTRGTQSYVDGMRYDGFIQWFYTPRKYAGLSFNLGLNGSTKYENTITEESVTVVKEENRVYNYLFVIRWRENFWKKWLFYEIGPGVNYHETHDYQPNYNFFFGIDMFFGHV